MWTGSKSLLVEYTPKVIPYGWVQVQAPIHGFCFKSVYGLAVITTLEWREEDPSEKWLHVSMSRSDRLPNYEDMMEVKNLFIGADRTAIQIFPPSDKHVNIHPNCLHLFCCVTREILPDFRREGGL